MSVITSALTWEYFETMSKLWVHVLTLSSAVFFLFFFFRVLKVLQDSRVLRYVCPKVSLLGGQDSETP